MKKNQLLLTKDLKIKQLNIKFFHVFGGKNLFQDVLKNFVKAGFHDGYWFICHAQFVAQASEIAVAAAAVEGEFYV